MAMSITPGYDFSVNEVPTRAKLQLMLAGSSLTGIDISQIDTNLVGIKLGDTSTSLPGEGWLWRDSINCLWVKTNHGPVKLFRGNWGGWETNRFMVRQTSKSGGLPGQIGMSMMDLVSATGNSENPIFKICDITAPNCRWSVKCTDTPVTDSYCRAIGRGGHVVVINGTITGHPKYVIRNYSALQGFSTEPFPNSTTLRGGRGLTMDRIGGGTNHENIYWHFGVRIMQD